MKLLFDKVRPVLGFAYILHVLLLLVLPVIVFILVRLDFVPLAFVVTVLSKWRVLAVKPRFWPSMLRVNAVDMMVGLAFVVFMISTSAMSWQILWTVLYAVWLVVLKPGTKLGAVALQGYIGMVLALVALYLVGMGADLIWLVLGSGMICYGAARHFFGPFEERHSKLLSSLFGFFAGALAWVLGHWLIYYGNGTLGQPAVLMGLFGLGLGLLYYLDHTEKLTPLLKKQISFVVVAITVILIVFSDWGNKIV